MKAWDESCLNCKKCPRRMRQHPHGRKSISSLRRVTLAGDASANISLQLFWAPTKLRNKTTLEESKSKNISAIIPSALNSFQNPSSTAVGLYSTILTLKRAVKVRVYKLGKKCSEFFLSTIDFLLLCSDGPLGS